VQYHLTQAADFGIHVEQGRSTRGPGLAIIRESSWIR